MTRSRYTSTADAQKRRRGITFTEMLMAIAIIGLITPVLNLLIVTVTQGFTQYEASTQIRKTNQQSLNRIYMRLGSCKKVFVNDASGPVFASRVTLSGGCPAVLSGSALPSIQPSFSPTFDIGTSSFAATAVGNCLFFANNETTSLVGSTSTRIDVYRFNYYYLTAENPYSITARSSYCLVEWRSVLYADVNQLRSITNANQKNNVVAGLVTNGITFAWDPTSTSANTAFYTLASNGAITLSATHTIPQYKFVPMTRMITGVLFGGFKYGISPNSSGWTAAPKTVPLYGTASGSFPGGFEVAITGPSDGRQVLLRSVIVAQGSMKRILGDDLLIVASARDLW